MPKRLGTTVLAAVCSPLAGYQRLFHNMKANFFKASKRESLYFTKSKSYLKHMIMDLTSPITPAYPKTQAGIKGHDLWGVHLHDVYHSGVCEETETHYGLNSLIQSEVTFKNS